MFPQMQKPTLRRVVILDVTLKYSIFKGLRVTSTRPSQHVSKRQNWCLLIRQFVGTCRLNFGNKSVCETDCKNCMPKSNPRVNYIHIVHQEVYHIENAWLQIQK